jgi:VWFA-related protein
MNSLRATLGFVVVFALLVAAPQPRLSAQAPAQKTPPPAKGPARESAEDQDPRYKIRVRTELVVVPVTVRTSVGRLVSDIRSEEFRIFEDGVEQTIDTFANEAFPLSAVVLLDNDLSIRASESVQKTIPVLAGGFGEFDEVAMILFDEVPKTVLEFTSENDRLFDHLKRMTVDAKFPGVGSGPMTAGPRVNQQSQQTGVNVRTSTRGQSVKHLDDAVYAAAEMLSTRDRDRRKIVFLISDGVNAKNNTHTYEEALKLLLTKDISVYAIGVGTTPGGRAFLALNRYAKATGGDVFYSNTRDELESLYARVTEQARNQYTLAYAPRGTDRGREYHEIEVRVRRPNLSILTREGYFTAPKL